MKLNDIYYRMMPYPVYGRMRDFIGAHKTLKLDESQIIAENENFKVTFKLSDFGTPELASLVEQGVAKCVCELDCQSGLYRDSVYSNENGASLEFNFDLSRRDVTGRTEFLFYLVAVKPINNYQTIVKGLNPIYEGLTINIETASCLALLGTCHHDFDIEYDKLQNAGAFMKVRASDKKPLPWVELTDKLIYVNLPQKMYKDFEEYDNRDKRTAGAIYLSSFVLNFLVEAVMTMHEHQYYKDDSPFIPMWARAICYKMKHSPEFDMAVFEDMRMSDAIELAQKLLGNPYESMFSLLKRKE